MNKYIKEIEEAITKHLLTKENPGNIKISFRSKIDNSKYGIETTVEDLAGDIAKIPCEKCKELKAEIEKKQFTIDRLLGK